MDKERLKELRATVTQMDNERIKELKATVEILRDECYVFNPLNLDRTIMINKALDVAIRELEKVIVALEQEPKTGHWIKNKRTFYTCDKCGFVNHYNRKKYNYCPNCGAKMESEEG